jgi:molecular chaperone DnaK
VGLAVGIDLGTTNSVAAVATEDGVRLVVDQYDNHVHPSAVSFPAGGGVLYGLDAKESRTVDAANTIYSAKRLIGQSVRSPMVQLALTSMPFRIEEGTNQQPIVLVRGRRMTVPEISGLILGNLKGLAERQLGHEVTDAVLTVPANFTDAQRQGTKEAGRLAGLDVLRLVNEPTAAALAYGYGQQLDELVAIFDFGGGTFDVSILQIRGEIFEVMATDGDFFLGGDDLDRALAEHLAAELTRTTGADPRPHPLAMTRLSMAAEEIKRYLSDEEEAAGDVDGIQVPGRGSLAVDFELNRSQFEALIAGYVDKTIDVCSQVMHAARVGAADIGQVILVGGSTRVPLVRQRVAELFGREPLDRINPDEVVAQGAALQAAILSGQVASAPSPRMAAADMDPTPLLLLDKAKPPANAVLLDVNPASLSVATAGGYTDRILDKNAPIPIERTKSFTTARDDQTRVVISCVRGENRRIDDNEILGELVLDNIAPARRGDVELAVTFRVDTDGILHVRAVDARTGQKQEARLNVIGAPVSSAARPGELPEELPEAEG